ncbi:MAG: hypothetical protein KA450_03985 [Bacteroidia bacterium]|nr:hypothetical protein [Bacteroidia bacterium]
MKDKREASYFTRVEDKYVFKISTAFWHLLIGIISLAGIVGTALFIWSLFPSSKEIIKAAAYPEKEAYPEAARVNLNDLTSQDEQVNVPSSISYSPPPQTLVSNDSENNDPDKQIYQLSFSELKRIIPKEQWQPGYYIYPKGELAWEVEQNENYRTWVDTGFSVELGLEKSYKKIKAENYKKKKNTLDSYIKLLKEIPTQSCKSVLQTILQNVNSSYTDSKLLDSAMNIIAINIQIFPDKADAANQLVGFVLNNPNTAFSFVPFSVGICNQVKENSRSQFLNALINGYYRNFNMSFEVQKDATTQFLDLLPQLSSEDPAKSLRKFYSIYNVKNKSRNDEINRINELYYTQVSAIISDSTIRALQAQQEYNAKKEEKADLRNKSIMAVVAGFIAIALLGTILTLLSIQRILKRIESATNKNNLV